MGDNRKSKIQGGPNSLRGGKKSYNGNVKLGNWTEDLLDPSASTSRSFTSPQYVTMSQKAMMDGMLIKPKYFGAALPPPENPRVDYSSVFHPDKSSSSANWSTITQSFHKGPSSAKVKGFSSTKQLPRGIGNAEALNEYIKRWTMESDQNRENHFATTNNTMLNSAVVPKYQIRETRLLPGLPLAVDKLLQKIHEKSSGRGTQGFSLFLQSHYGNKTVSLPTFKSAIKTYGVEMSAYDVDQLLAFLDVSGNGSVSVMEVLAILRGPFPENRSTATKAMYGKLLQRARSTHEEGLLLASLSKLYNPRSDYEVVEEKITSLESTSRFVSRWAPYTKEGSQVISEDQFIEYYHDITLNIPSDAFFMQLLSKTWETVEV